MSEHLRHEELVDAMDDALAVARRAHLDACDTCRTELARMRAVLLDVDAVEIPEPSPLFWEHFSERVRQATAVQPVPSAGSWWRAWWRPAGVITAAAAALALVLVLRPSVNVREEPGVASAKVAALEDDGSWGLVVGIASELDAADVREAAKPAEGTVDAMIEELTAAQRTALARLLQEDIGGLQ